MLFNSLHFLIFFPVVCIIYFLLPSLKSRNLFLLVASYYFYMNWEPVYALLLLTSTAITYLAARGIARYDDRHKKRLFLTVSLLLNLGMLFLFKYYNFAADNLTALFAHWGIPLHMPAFTWLLPVGISFYIFQALGYSIDVYRGHIPVEKNFFDYALFVSFFPQLVAGPIERSFHLLPQFKQMHAFSYENTMKGLRLMLWGYFLKLVLADRCALYIDPIFNDVAANNGGSFLLAALFFPFQIYGDFAGYSLAAIGSAKIMGFDLMDNFRRPYFATTITDFWHRWHISLSTWFKDYVYIPLGGNRISPRRTYLNLLTTFIISGIWHGANWTFIAWGTLHGLLQCLEKRLGWHKRQWTGVPKALHWLLTFCIVCLAWIFFRANTITDAFHILCGIFTDFGPAKYGGMNFYAIGGALLVLFFREAINEYGWQFHVPRRLRLALIHLGMVAMTVYILLFGVLNGDQFIYFQF